MLMHTMERTLLIISMSQNKLDIYILKVKGVHFLLP